LDKKAFPLKLWKRLFSKAIDSSIDFGIYPNGQGEFGLRIQIKNYLEKSRAVNCNEDQIIITNSFAESMGLIAKMLKNSVDTLAIEDPAYHIALKVFQSYSYEIKKIPLDTNGIKIAELKNSRTKLVYITPSHQYPTGVSIPITNRLNLLKWADENNSFIIEDDYDSELTYENRPIPSLQGLDNNQRVIYLGTLSKALSPALRVSYMVIPKNILPLYKIFMIQRSQKYL
jgi:GntR family transcriptional regulator/MocR family aminotransferase